MSDTTVKQTAPKVNSTDSVDPIAPYSLLIKLADGRLVPAIIRRELSPANRRAFNREYRRGHYSTSGRKLYGRAHG